jgi:hypothetical protein
VDDGDDAVKTIDVPAGRGHRFVLRLPWVIEIEKEGDGKRVDEAWLEREGGGYRELAGRASAKDGGSHWRFRFPRGPEGTYRVDLVSRGVRYCVWKGLHLPAEHEDSAPPAPAAAPTPPPRIVVLDATCGGES